jgi:hypothetical protein
VVKDVVIANNIIRHTNNAILLLSQDDDHTSQLMENVTLSNNLVYDIAQPRWGRGDWGGVFLVLNGPGGKNFTVTHNTVVNSDAGVLFTANASLTNLVILDNIFHAQILGGDKAGTDALLSFVSGWLVRRNVIVIDHEHDYWANRYPPDNFYPSSFSQVGFVDLSRADLRLHPKSNLRGKATSGGDIGVNFDQLPRLTDLQSVRSN